MVVIQATAFAQGGMKITIQKENITVIEALKEVEKQSKLSVGYNDSQLIDKPAINLNLKNIDLEKPSRLSLKEQDLLMELKEIILILFLNQRLELWLLNR